MEAKQELEVSESTRQYIEKLEAKEEFSSSYRITLGEFEGPLDLLLHLVKQARIKIEEIFVSKITDHYLEYMKQIETIDLEKASDFIEIAAILIEIKSKTLLPRPEEIESDEHDPKKLLIQKLEEYKLYKEACAKMKEKEIIGTFYKSPDSSVGDPRIVLKDMTMDGLMLALQKMFLKLDKRVVSAPQRQIVKDRFTVADKMENVKDLLLMKEEFSFFELFEDDYSKTEIITTFQALLELLKLQYIKAIQEEAFGDIQLKRVEKVA